MVCRICLRSDIAAVEDIDCILVEFYRVLCENNMAVEEDPMLKYCGICEHQLKKFYNFQQKCRRANNTLKAWWISHDLKSLQKLQEMIPPTNITIQKAAEPILMEFPCTEPVVVKLEIDDTKIENSIIPQEMNDQSINIILDDNNFNDLKIEDSYCDMNDNNDNDDDNDDDDDTDYEPIKKKTKTINNLKTKKKTKVNTIKKTERVTRNKSVKDSKLISKKKDLISKQVKLKERILNLLEMGEFQDLGEHVTINKEIFTQMYDKCDQSGLKRMLLLKPGSSEERQKLKKFLLHLLRKNNPQYEDIFSVELLDTEDKKLQEFHRRRLSKEYCQAPFKCELCYRGFEVQRLLDYHKRWHESAGEFECEICAMRFSSRKALAQHRNTNHCALYRCKLCPLLTYNSAVMVNHYNQHKGMEYSCPICLSVFSNKNTLNNHRRQAHVTSHVCPLCARTFVSEKGLYFHKRLKHKEEIETKSESSVSCDKCSATLTSPALLATHTRLVHDSPHTIHKCFHCKEIFTSLEELKKHKVEKDHQRPPKSNKVNELSKSDVEASSCAECARTFNSRKSYLRHVNTHHRANRIHKCGFCQAKFPTAEELESHRAALSHQRKSRHVRKQRARVGTGKRLRCSDPEKPFEKCQLCGEAVCVRRSSGMYRHFVSRHPDTPYAAVYAQPHYRHLCHLCGKTFKDLTFFVDHANVHSGARPFACGCGRAFSSRRHLRQHAARHAPPTHTCTTCRKAFHSAANLYAHTRGHIGDRRFKCEICAKGFLHSAALGEHVRGVHHHVRRARKNDK